MKRILLAGGLMLWAGAGHAVEDFIDGVRIEDSSTGIADLFVDDASVLDGKLCIGEGCIRAEAFDADTLVVLKSDSNIIDFFDTSSGGSEADTNWQIRANEPGAHGANWFAIRNESAGVTPFKIWSSAIESGLVLNSLGVGIGTQSPQSDLHIVAGALPSVRLEQDGSQGMTPYIWDYYLGASGALLLWDRTGSERRMVFRPATVEEMQTIEVYGDGSVALTDNGGSTTFLPDAPLHLTREDGNTRMRIEERSTIVTPRTMLDLQNNGRPEIVMANNSTGKEWAFGAGSNFVLKTGAIGSTDAEKTLHLKLFGATGNMEITGQIITGGGTCGGGCDRVFTEQQIIPAERYAAQMWKQGHLPHVGPTKEGAPINVSEKLGGMLNALEHAHVFIEAQRGEITALKADKAAMEARMARMEAQMAALMAKP